jgi:hypothetical protein
MDGRPGVGPESRWRLESIVGADGPGRIEEMGGHNESGIAEALQGRVGIN